MRCVRQKAKTKNGQFNTSLIYRKSRKSEQLKPIFITSYKLQRKDVQYAATATMKFIRFGKKNMYHKVQIFELFCPNCLSLSKQNDVETLLIALQVYLQF